MSASHTIVVLLLNTIGSFAVATAIAWTLIGVFRIRDGRARVVLLGLPFANVLFDLAGGAWAGTSSPLLSTAPRGFYRFGLTDLGTLRFQVVLQSADGTPVSIGELIANKLAMHAPYVLPLLVVSLCVPSAILVGRRVVAWIRFERARRCLRARATFVKRIALTGRSVELYHGPSTVSVPHSGGVLRSYVCIPQAVAQRLTPSEYQAVLAHELGHVRSFDPLLQMALGLWTDLFWFVPGSRRQAASVIHACELCADDHASRTGGAAALARAMVHVAELCRHAAPSPVAAVGRSARELETRALRLVSAATHPRSRWRVALLAVVRGAVVIAGLHSLHASGLGALN